MQKLIELEEQGWQALSTEGDAGQQFYAAVLDDEAVMLFPGGMLIAGKEKILASLAAVPWKTYKIADAQVLTLAENVGAVVYKVTAQREGAAPYAALISSTYARRDGEWKLVLHQQTPS